MASIRENVEASFYPTMAAKEARRDGAEWVLDEIESVIDTNTSSSPQEVLRKIEEKIKELKR